MNKYMDGWMDGCINRLLKKEKDGQVKRKMDRWSYRRLKERKRWMDGQ